MKKTGKVTASSLRLRDAPQDGAIIGSLPNATEVTILGEADGWLQVLCGDDVGYVSAAYVDVTEPPRTGRVMASSLNLRDAPNGRRIGSLDEDTKVVILSEDGDWLKVEADEGTGWVAGSYVKEDEAGAGKSDPLRAADPEFRVEGRDVFGPDGTRFARTFRLGLFSSGETSIAEYVTASRNAFPALSDSTLNVMQAVSVNEGNLEAINTWDNAFLTFGAFQWTVGTADGPGELPALLYRLLEDDEGVFDDLFGRHGLGLEDVRLPDSEPGRGYFTLDGRAVRTPEEKEQLRTMVWAYRFKVSGENDVMRRTEIRHAAGRVDLFYRSDLKQIRGRHVAEYVTSEYGVALLLDQHVNRPGHVPRTMTQAVDRMTEERGGSDDPENWSDEEEARLLEIYVEIRNETSMTDAADRAARTRQAVEQGLASDRRGSYQG